MASILGCGRRQVNDTNDLKEAARRRMRALWKLNGAKGRCRGALGLCCGAQRMTRRAPKRIAMHGKAQRKHSVLTFPPHHQGIPLGVRRAENKITIHLRQRAPEVEKRSLAAYECVANGGGR